MEWKKFEELNQDYPEAIVLRKIAGFENATDNLASLLLAKLEGPFFLSETISGEFKFALFLQSQYLKHYRLKLLVFGYGIRFSPIYYSIEESIDKEIFGDHPFSEGMRINRTAEVESEFDNMLDLVFKSQAFEKIVSGLMKVARKEIPEF